MTTDKPLGAQAIEDLRGHFREAEFRGLEVEEIAESGRRKITIPPNVAQDLIAAFADATKQARSDQERVERWMRIALAAAGVAADVLRGNVSGVVERVIDVAAEAGGGGDAEGSPED